MGRGDRHLRTDATAPERSVRDARFDAHAWIDRGFDAVESVVQGVAEMFRGAADIAAGRRPSRVAPNLDALGEWYVDKLFDADSGRPVWIVTNGDRVVECRSREMADEVVAALNAQGVRTRNPREQGAAGTRGEG